MLKNFITRHYLLFGILFIALIHFNITLIINLHAALKVGSEFGTIVANGLIQSCESETSSK
jgi:hypothetical protein